jgi:hypothetical protein
VSTIEVQGWSYEGHSRVSFLTEDLARALVDQTPFSVPGQAFWSDLPVHSRWNLETTAALDRINRDASNIKI